MKVSPLAVFVVTILTGCAAPTGSSAAKLQPGAYQLTSFDSNGNKVGGPVKIDIPFNDQSFAIGSMCINDRAARVVATDRNAQNPVWFDCVRRQVNGITEVAGSHR